MTEESETEDSFLFVEKLPRKIDSVVVGVTDVGLARSAGKT